MVKVIFGLENMAYLGKDDDQIVLAKAREIGKEKIRAKILNLQFPDDKKEISQLKIEDLLEWYAHQFKKTPGIYPIHLLSKEFEAFWRWRVLIPTKIKRFFYRVKNGEIFKKYPHISEIKKNKKK